MKIFLLALAVVATQLATSNDPWNNGSMDGNSLVNTPTDWPHNSLVRPYSADTCSMKVANIGHGVWSVFCVGGCDDPECEDWTWPDGNVWCLCNGEFPATACFSVFNIDTHTITACYAQNCSLDPCQTLGVPLPGTTDYICRCP